MRKFLVLSTCLSISACALAMGKAGGKPFIEAKAQVAENLKLADELSALKVQIKSLQAKIDTQASAQAGANNRIERVSTELTAARDAISNSNNRNDKEIFKWQTDLYKYQANIWKNLFYWTVSLLGGWVSFLQVRLWWITKFTLRGRESDAQYYRTELAALTNAQTMENVMTKKREIEKRKTWLAKTRKFIQEVRGNEENPASIAVRDDGAVCGKPGHRG